MSVRFFSNVDSGETIGYADDCLLCSVLGKSTRSYVVTLQQVHPDYTRASEIEQPRARTSWRLRFYRSDNAGLPRSGAPPDPSSSDAAPTFVLDVHYCRDFPCSDPVVCLLPLHLASSRP